METANRHPDRPVRRHQVLRGDRGPIGLHGRVRNQCQLARMVELPVRVVVAPQAVYAPLPVAARQAVYAPRPVAARQVGDPVEVVGAAEG